MNAVDGGSVKEGQYPAMRIGAILFTIIMMLLLTAAALPDGNEAEGESSGATDPANAEADQPAAKDDGPRRVIVYVSRNREVAGTIELEDDEVIVVRTQRGEVETFVKTRVLQIVRLVDPGQGRKGMVLLRDGQIREGVILEDEFEHVLMEIEGIRARLVRDIVERVVLEPTFEEQYQELLDSLEPHQHGRYLLFCQWLVEERRYDLAQTHLQTLLGRLDRDMSEFPEAQRLLRLAEAQLALRSETARRDDVAVGEAERRRAEALDRKHLLTPEQVNLIRMYEFDFDRPPRVTVKPDTIEKMFAIYGTDSRIPASRSEREAMFRADPMDIVRLLFELRARELYGEVQVETEPYALNLFRQRVHNRWLLHNCATSGCHGGPEPGRFALYRRGYRHDRVRYANFLILERLDLEGEWPLINYDEPEMSLVIQYGLPRNRARLPHPDVRGWRPAFRSTDDRMVQDTVHWIESMMQPRPEYPIEFDPNEIIGAATGADEAWSADEPAARETDRPARQPR